jgi:hypothetical protein
MSARPRRLLIAAVGIVLLAAAAVAGLWVTRDARPDAGTEATGAEAAASSSGEPVSAIPGEASAEPGTPVLEPGPAQEVATDPEPVTTGGDVDVVVTYTAWDADLDTLEVDGYVSGVVEEGGTCTLTATNAGRTVTAEGPGTADAATTSCGALVLSGEELTAGSWEVQLGYESATSSGASPTSVVEVDR